jgi:hypothetical protein
LTPWPWLELPNQRPRTIARYQLAFESFAGLLFRAPDREIDDREQCEHNSLVRRSRSNTDGAGRGSALPGPSRRWLSPDRTTARTKGIYRTSRTPAALSATGNRTGSRKRTSDDRSTQDRRPRLPARRRQPHPDDRSRCITKRLTLTDFDSKFTAPPLRSSSVNAGQPTATVIPCVTCVGASSRA